MYLPNDKLYIHSSDWTSHEKFQQGCTQLETRFWAHITTREGMSKIELEQSTPYQGTLTVDRDWYGKSIL